MERRDLTLRQLTPEGVRKGRIDETKPTKVRPFEDAGKKEFPQGLMVVGRCVQTLE
jgi:hypothetical protein